MNDFSKNMPTPPEHPSESTTRDAVGTYMTRASMFHQLRQADAGQRERAWGLFRDRYAPIIAGFAGRCGASRQDIDDIVQDVMAAFVGAHGEFHYDPAKGRFRGWLKTCTVRAAIRRAGKNLRFKGVPLEDVADAELATEAVWNDVWEAQLVSNALSILKQEAGDSIPFRAFEQYVLLDRDASVVAGELDVSVDNIYQAKLRMTKRLREIVQRLREFER